jgi:hypothetical protein
MSLPTIGIGFDVCGIWKTLLPLLCEDVLGRKRCQLGRGRKCDLVLLSNASHAASFPNKPYIVSEVGLDGAELAKTTRDALRGDRPPAAVWKNAIYANLDKYNECDCPWQVNLCRQAFVGHLGSSGSPRPIDVERLGLIRSPVRFGTYARPQSVALSCHSTTPCDERQIDVSFAGRVDYPDAECKFQGYGKLISQHRESCCKAIENLESDNLVTVASRGEAMSHEQYVRSLLCRSKIVVAPYGWGEMTMRHYEAIFAGCVLIAPLYSYIDEWQSRFQCKPDWSDLGKVVMKALEWIRKPDSQAKMDDVRTELIRKCIPRNVADRMWNDIEAALGATIALRC